MPTVRIDLEEYIEEFSTEELQDELKRRNEAALGVLDDDAVDSIIKLMEVGRWRDALAALIEIRRSPLDLKWRDRIAAKYAEARRAP